MVEVGKYVGRRGNLDVKVDIVRDNQLIKRLYSEEDFSWKLGLADDSNPPFRGFHYFRPESFDACGRDAHFLLAYDPKDNSENGIIGVAKIGVYNKYGYLPDFWATNFIDVRKDQQGKGIATRLVYELGQLLNSKDVLVSSDESEMGREVGMHQMQREIITSCPFFKNIEEFWEYLAS